MGGLVPSPVSLGGVVPMTLPMKVAVVVTCEITFGMN